MEIKLTHYPLGRNVIVRPTPDQPTRLALPGSGRPATQQATVLAVGDGRREGDLKPVEFVVKPGDTVLIRRNYGRPVVTGAADLVVREDHLLALVEDDA